MQFSLLVLLLGVGIATVTDLELNFVGTVIAALAILTTCIGQIVSTLLIHSLRSTLFHLQFPLFQQFPVFLVLTFFSLTQMTNTIQKSHKISSTQLLYQSSPFQAGILLLTGPFVDGFLTGQNVFSFNYGFKVTVCVFIE